MRHCLSAAAPPPVAGELEGEGSEVQSMHSTLYGGAASVGQVSPQPAVAVLQRSYLRGSGGRLAALQLGWPFLLWLGVPSNRC
jgi:hypothetical protein